MVFSHRQREGNAVEKFIRQYHDRISGVITCFDRILCKGYLPIGWGDAMERLLSRQGLLIKDFKQFVMKHSECIKDHAEAIAAKQKRPLYYINGRIRKVLFRPPAEPVGGCYAGAAGFWNCSRAAPLADA